VFFVATQNRKVVTGILLVKMRPSSSTSSSREKFRRKSSKDLLGSIAETSGPPVSPSVDATTVSSDDDDDDDDDDIDLAVRPLERRDRSFLNNSVRSSPTKFGRSGSERSVSSSSSIRLLDKSKRESSLLTPQQQDSPQTQSQQHEPDSTKTFRKEDDYASALSQLVTVAPKRARSMVDGLRRKSSLRDELARETSPADGTPTRRHRSFVESCNTGSVRRSWLRRSKSQVQLMVLGSFISDVKLPLKCDSKTSLSPQRKAHTFNKTPRSGIKTPSSPASSPFSRRGSKEHSRSEVEAEAKQDIVSKESVRRSTGSPITSRTTVVPSKSKSPRNVNKIVTTKDLKNEMDLLLHGGKKSFNCYNHEDDQNDDYPSLHDSAQEDNSRSLNRYPSLRKTLNPIQSVAESESSGSASSQCGSIGLNSDEDFSETSIARMSTPTTSNLKKTALPSPVAYHTSGKEIRSKPVTRSSASSGPDVGDDVPVSSSYQYSLRPKLSSIVRSSPLLKASLSRVPVDVAGAVRSYPASCRNLPPPESPTASPGFLRRLNKSLVGKDDRRRPTEAERESEIPPIFDKAFYSSSHHRRTMATRSLMWTTDRQSNFSDWTLLIIRVGVSWETSNVDTYHIHKSVVGVGPRPSHFLLDHFEDQESVFVRNTSSVELFSQAADLVPTMLDHIYGMRGEPLHITTATATALRYLADKFGVETMFREVNEFIQRDLNGSTVDTYNNDAELFKDKQLMQAAFRLQKALRVST
jgi:hypothetical protein